MSNTYPTPPNVPGTLKKSNKDTTRSDMLQDFGPEGTYQVVKDGNSWILNGTSNAKIPGRVYLFIDKNGDYDILGAEAVRKAYMDEAKKSKGGVEYLRQRLYNAGYMLDSEYSTKDSLALARAITDSASDISTRAVMDFVDNDILITQSFDKYLNTAVAGNAKQPKSGSGLNISTKIDTDQDIDSYFFDMLGRRATPQEKQEYYNEVIKEEKAALVKQKTDTAGKTTTTGEYLDQEDYARIRAKIIKPAIKGTDLESLTKGNGSVAQGVSSLKEYAASYGIRLDTKQALDKVMETFSPSGQTDLKIAQNAIKSMAKGFYGNISNLIDEGVKPSDIANQYAYYKGQLLELPDNAISIFDEDIQAALSNKDASGAQKAGVMTLTEYERLLRTSPKTKQKWLETKGAREEASAYALNILRSFGLMA